jgi:hypothetical protein
VQTRKREEIEIVFGPLDCEGFDAKMFRVKTVKILIAEALTGFLMISGFGNG